MGRTHQTLPFRLDQCSRLSLGFFLLLSTGGMCSQAAGADSGCGIGQTTDAGGGRGPGSSADSRSEHRLGAGDTLRLTVWNGEVLEEAVLRVAEDETLFVPFGLNKTISVRGCTSTTLKRSITEELTRFYRDPRVQVVVEGFGARKAYLHGEIRGGPDGGRGPGHWPLSGQQRVLEFIVENGGFSEKADLSQIRLNRPGRKPRSLNLSGAMFQGNESENPLLEDGDIVWVPPVKAPGNSYYVFGDVRRPGVIHSPTQLDLTEALFRVGGLTAGTSRAEIFVIRGELENPETRRVGSEEVLRKREPRTTVSLRNRDIVYVSEEGRDQAQEIADKIGPFILAVVRDAIALERMVEGN